MGEGLRAAIWLQLQLMVITVNLGVEEEVLLDLPFLLVRMEVHLSLLVLEAVVEVKDRVLLAVLEADGVDMHPLEVVQAGQVVPMMVPMALAVVMDVEMVVEEVAVILHHQGEVGMVVPLAVEEEAQGEEQAPNLILRAVTEPEAKSESIVGR